MQFGETLTKCKPNANQMRTKCIPNAYQMQTKCIPNANQMRTKCDQQPEKDTFNTTREPSIKIHITQAVRQKQCGTTSKCPPATRLGPLWPCAETLGPLGWDSLAASGSAGNDVGPAAQTHPSTRAGGQDDVSSEQTPN